MTGLGLTAGARKEEDTCGKAENVKAYVVCTYDRVNMLEPSTGHQKSCISFSTSEVLVAVVKSGSAVASYVTRN